MIARGRIALMFLAEISACFELLAYVYTRDPLLGVSSALLLVTGLMIWGDIAREKKKA